MTLRISNSITAKPERWLLDRLCRALPVWVTPDWLTFLGFIGAGIVFAGYVLSNWHRGYLQLALVGYVIHWFGDSMDGSFARHLGIERPRYGYFVDHSVDAFGNFIIMAGLGLTQFVRMDVSLFALIGYLLLSIHVFLRRQVLDEFQLSFIALGPTELRIALFVITLLMPWLNKFHFLFGPLSFSAVDGVMVLAGMSFLCIFVWSFLKTAARLQRENP